MLNLRASLAVSGVGQMLEDGLAVIESERTTRSRWLVGGYRTVGIAYLMVGQAKEAVAALNEALLLTEGHPELLHVRVFCLGMLALAHADRGEWTWAERYTREGEANVARYDEAVQGLPILLMRARLSARNGDRVATLDAIAKARGVAPTRLGPSCLRAELTLRCAQAAHLVGADDVAKELVELCHLAASRAGDAGTVPQRLNDLAATMSVDWRLRQLTPAEIRVLRQLATHRTLKQIAEHLYVSRATVKTHVGAIYAKLGVSSRAEAVALLVNKDASIDQATS
jgi:LuxR family maltose regulon positive regulatory protein